MGRLPLVASTLALLTSIGGLSHAADAGAPKPASPAPVVAPAHPAKPQAPAAKPQSPAPKPPAPQAAGKPKAPPGPAKPAPDAATRRQVAAGPTVVDSQLGADTPELRAMAAAEREMFPPAMPVIGAPWPHEASLPLPQNEALSRIHTSGLPPAPTPPPVALAEGGKDLSWLAKAELPDLPVRWDARVVRYLEFFKDDPRGRAIISTWLRRSGRYRDAIRRTLKRKGAPEDLLYLSMIESGFEVRAKSPVGAMGLWQFMPETGRTYGLPQDRWADARLHASHATEAAADYLLDLHRRFGSWELAMAAYNLGYGGMMGAVKRYNTNDFWSLADKEGSLPWETTLYVPKVLAAAIVGHNLALFGLQDLTFDAPLDGDDVVAPAGTPLAAIAQAAVVTPKEVEALNPELRAGRTPPGSDYTVKVPLGKGVLCTQNLAKVRGVTLDKYTLRFGETLEQVAERSRVPVSRLLELNGISKDELVRGGTVLLVPKAPETPMAAAGAMPPKPVVVVPDQVFSYPDRKRVFYRVLTGDTLPDIAKVFHVGVDEVRRWNDIDPEARLIDGMTLQLFVPKDTDLSKVISLSESFVVPVVAGTPEFFERFEEKGRKRVTVVAKAGETLEQLAKRSNVTPGLAERINRRPRTDVLKQGENVVLYVPGTNAPKAQVHAVWPAPADVPDEPPPLP